MLVQVTSFGYKSGLPPAADLVFDVRFMENPFYIPELRDKDGRDPAVRKFVLGHPATREFLERVMPFLRFALPRYDNEKKARLEIALGCTGGRHRSVVLGDEIAGRPRGEATRARRLLIAAGLAPRARSRRGRAVLMLRSAEAIAAFLRLTGATETLLRFEARRVQREVRGRTNAAVNAESANLARTVAAAREQTAAIRALARTGRLARLPSELRGAAAARTHAPEATLSQLAARVSTTKWAMRQRRA